MKKLRIFREAKVTIGAPLTGFLEGDILTATGNVTRAMFMLNDRQHVVPESDSKILYAEDGEYEIELCDPVTWTKLVEAEHARALASQ